MKELAEEYQDKMKQAIELLSEALIILETNETLVDNDAVLTLYEKERLSAYVSSIAGLAYAEWINRVE